MRKKRFQKDGLKNGWDLPPGEKIPLTGRKQRLIRAYELLVLASDDEYKLNAEEEGTHLVKIPEEGTFKPRMPEEKLPEEGTPEVNAAEEQISEEQKAKEQESEVQESEVQESEVQESEEWKPIRAYSAFAPPQETIQTTGKSEQEMETVNEMFSEQKQTIDYDRIFRPPS